MEEIFKRYIVLLIQDNTIQPKWNWIYSRFWINFR